MVIVLSDKGGGSIGAGATKILSFFIGIFFAGRGFLGLAALTSFVFF